MRRLSSNLPRRVLRKPIQEELGFGKNVTTTNRIMNADGSFNVERQPSSIWDNTYYNLISMPWRYFFLLVLGCYVVLNLFFAAVYLLIGTGQINGMPSGSVVDKLSTAFFFSTQTLTTVGYGVISPHGFLANLVASLESFLGLLAFALVSGLMYGRFSRPKAKIVFSENLLVAPYKDGKALMFRMSNARRSELIETDVKVLLALNQTEDSGEMVRKFFNLKLEIEKIPFFSLSWTIVHHIGPESPLVGFNEQDLIDGQAELLVLVKGTDETNHQLVHTRRSYGVEDVVWNARFSPVITKNRKGQPHVITGRIGAHELIKS